MHVVSTARQVALNGLAEGHSRNGAAALAGVSDQTLRNCMRADNDYLDAVEAAEREALAKVEAVFLAGAMRDPRLALAYLERKEPSWQRSQPVMVTRETLEASLAALSDAQFERLTRLVDAEVAAQAGEVFVIGARGR